MNLNEGFSFMYDLNGHYGKKKLNQEAFLQDKRPKGGYALKKEYLTISRSIL